MNIEAKIRDILDKIKINVNVSDIQITRYNWGFRNTYFKEINIEDEVFLTKKYSEIFEVKFGDN